MKYQIFLSYLGKLIIIRWRERHSLEVLRLRIPCKEVENDFFAKFAEITQIQKDFMKESLIATLISVACALLLWAVIWSILRRRVAPIFDRGLRILCAVPALHLASGLAFYATSATLFQNFNAEELAVDNLSANEQAVMDTLGGVQYDGELLILTMLVFVIMQVVLLFIRKTPFYINEAVGAVGSIVLMFYFNLINDNIQKVFEFNESNRVLTSSFLADTNLYYLIMQGVMFFLILALVVAHIVKFKISREYFNTAIR